jgi:hypothetical protein
MTGLQVTQLIQVLNAIKTNLVILVWILGLMLLFKNMGGKE